MTDPAFTILLPVHRPPALLPYAIASVLAQDRRDFELFVICDGAPPETAAVARDYAATDPRIRVFEHPKGERNGEIYRHQALMEARGEYVCQIGDDDMWFPNHLDEMAILLAEFDFGNLAHVEVLNDGQVVLFAGNLANAGTRSTMRAEAFNFFGPTVCGYRLQAYRSLPIGWAPGPSDLPSDLFMWRKFLAREELRLGTRIVVTTVKFANQTRQDWSLERRRAEIAAWAARLSNPADRDVITQSALCRMSETVLHLSRQGARKEQVLQKLRAKLKRSVSQSAQSKQKLQAMRRSWSWRLTRPFRWLARRIVR